MLLRLLGGLAVALSPIIAHAAPPILIATSPHFTIYSAESEADLRTRASDLERYSAVLHRLTQTRDTGDVAPLTIYVMADQASVGAGNYVLGFYIPNAASPFAVVPRKVRSFAVASMPHIPQIILFHEYAHHFMLQNFAKLYSPWFIEGFAEFYSTTEIVGTTAMVGKPEPLRIHDLMLNWKSPLAPILAPGDRQLTVEQRDQLYARAWLLVHYLTLSKARGGQIDAYLRARSTGQTEEQAFQSAFHTSIAGMDQELKTYFTPHQLSYITLDIPEAGAVAIRQATAAEIAVSKLMPRLRILQDEQSGMTGPKSTTANKVSFDHWTKQLAIDARGSGRKYPNDSALQVMVAESELLAGELDPARASADAALQLDPKNARAHLVLATVALGNAQPAQHDLLAAGRKQVVVANRAAPDDPMPLIAYYRSFVDHGEPAPSIAVQGLVRAQQLAPQDDEVRLMLAKEEIAVKHYTNAAELLRPVAFAPHGGTKRDAAQALLKTIPGNPVEAPPPVVPAPVPEQG